MALDKLRHYVFLNDRLQLEMVTVAAVLAAEEPVVVEPAAVMEMVKTFVLVHLILHSSHQSYQ